MAISICSPPFRLAKHHYTTILDFRCNIFDVAILW